MMKNFVTFGEIMLRLSPPPFYRIAHTHSFDVTFGGAEANVAVSLAQSVPGHLALAQGLGGMVMPEAAPPPVATPPVATPPPSPKGPIKPIKAAAAPKASAKTPNAPAKMAGPAFAPALAFTAPQQELLRLFAANGLALSQARAEAFAKRQGALRNQLIDGLNDACYELLDDVLIEESDDGYTIFEPYYQKIVA